MITIIMIIISLWGMAKLVSILDLNKSPIKYLESMWNLMDRVVGFDCGARAAFQWNGIDVASSAVEMERLRPIRNKESRSERWNWFG